MLLVAEGEALFLRLRGALSLFLGSAAVLALEPGWSWSLFLLLGTLFLCAESGCVFASRTVGLLSFLRDCPCERDDFPPCSLL